jgi:16S rRNA (guanine527-N7)-methyltransferase
VEHEEELCEFTISSIRELGLEVGEIHVEQFMRYLGHLMEWNKVTNLTSITDPRDIIVKHFVDSLAALVVTDFSQNSLVLDVGSGAGFPGIPLKIVRPDLRLTLIEPVQKKCSFLNSLVGLLRLHHVSTFNGTIQQYSKASLRHSIDIAVVRALKYEEISETIDVVLTSKGRVVLYRTEMINRDGIDKRFHLASETSLTLPHESGRRVLTVIEKSL